jgi:hypothetical protein
MQWGGTHPASRTAMSATWSVSRCVVEAFEGKLELKYWKQAFIRLLDLVRHLLNLLNHVAALCNDYKRKH